MVLINLLPWRAQQQQYLHKQMKRLLAASAVFAVLLLCVVHMLLQQWMAILEAHLAELRPQVAYAVLRHQKPEQSSISQRDMMSAELVNQMLDVRSAGVCFTAIKRYQNKVQVFGKVNTPEYFSTFFSAWPAVSHFSQIRINQMKPDSEGLFAVEFEGIEKQGDKRHG